MKFADLSTAEKLEHIWIYYKFHILGGIALILIVVYFISSMAGRIPSALNVEIVSDNIPPRAAAALQARATAALIPAGRREQVQVGVLPMAGTLASPQNENAVMGLMARIAARDIDVFIADRADFSLLAKDGVLADLSRTGLPRAVFANPKLAVSARVKGGHAAIVGLNLGHDRAFQNLVRPRGDNIVGIMKGAAHMSQARRFVAWLLR